MKILITIVSIFFVTISSPAQTYLYKRVMIVKGNEKVTTNDDAHFITFNTKGCYESDEKGFATDGCLIAFLKNENNLHCYYGNGYYGLSHYYFANDFSRLNVNVDGTIYVYQRENGNKTSAKYRGNKSNNGGTIIMPIGMPNISNNTQSTTSSRRVCFLCKGTGQGYNETVYQTNYTGKTYYQYCAECGTSKAPHTHIHHTCGTCHGKGYIE